MSLCSTCQNIDIPNFPTFEGFNSKLSAHGVGKISAQPHHASFKDLKLSAEDCSLCEIFLRKFKEASAKDRGKIYSRDLLPDETPVTLRGLSREGWSEDRKQLYGIQVACGSWFHNFGLYADEGKFIGFKRSFMTKMKLMSYSRHCRCEIRLGDW
jgi:hypothetical protein